MICTKCEREKEPHEFGKDRKRKTGLFPYCKECKRNIMREYRLRTNESVRLKERYENDSEYRKKVRARSLINMRRTRAGRKLELCSSCGEEGAQAHHPDYDKPDVVVYLCQTCHMQEH